MTCRYPSQDQRFVRRPSRRRGCNNSAGRGTRRPREALYWHFPHYGLTPPSTAIRKGDYKLIQFHEGSIELYDLKSDLGETRNLAGEMPQKVAELSAMIGDWLKKMDAWMAIPNPNYDPAATPPPPSARRLEMLRQRAKNWF